MDLDLSDISREEAVLVGIGIGLQTHTDAEWLPDSIAGRSPRRIRVYGGYYGGTY